MAIYDLSNHSIAQIGEDVAGYLTTTSLDTKEQLRILLTLEEVLLRYQQQFDADHTVNLRYGKEWGRPRITITMTEMPCNPVASDSDLYDSQILHNLLNSQGTEPTWQYNGGRNVIFWVLPKKPQSMITKLAIAILLAVVLGLATSLLPENVVQILGTWVVTPLFNTFMGILVGISGPLIFLSVAWGIYSIGDASTFSHIGKTMIGRFLILTPILSILGNAWLLAVFPISAGESTLSFDAFSSIYQMILDVIPVNIVAPFADNNPMQIITLAIVVGSAMLVLGKKATAVAAMLEQTNFIVQYIMECISALVPYFIFISIFNMFLSGQLQAISAGYKPLLCMLVCSLLIVVGCALTVSIRCKVNFFLLVKKLLPTFIIGVTTDSSAAAFPTNFETCQNKLGIDLKIINLGLPLGQVIFMPGALILFFSMAISMAEIYHVPLTPTWIVMAFFVTCLVSIAAPPIPGSPLTCYTLIFTQLGIPSEAVALAIVLNVVLGCLATGINLYGLQCELTLLSRQLGMLDLDCLRK